MFDISWSEMAIIVLVALVVVGPKDLPKVLRTFGQFMRKARSLSREFQSGLNDMLREAELEEARKAIENTRAGQLDREIRKALDPGDEVEKELRDLDREARNSKPPSHLKEASSDAVGKDRLAQSTREPSPQPTVAKAEAGEAKVIKHPGGSVSTADGAAEPPGTSGAEAAEELAAEAERAKKTG